MLGNKGVGIGAVPWAGRCGGGVGKGGREEQVGEGGGEGCKQGRDKAAKGARQGGTVWENLNAGTGTGKHCMVVV